MQGPRFGDSWRFSYRRLKDDLRESHQEKFDWLLEEFEIQFLNEYTVKNEEKQKEFARKYYLDYLMRLSIDPDPAVAELGKFGLDLLYLQFPDL